MGGKAYDTSDHYIFSKDSIISVNKFGLTTKHKDHYHYIAFRELEQSEPNQAVDSLTTHHQLNSLKAVFDKNPTGKAPLFDAKKITKNILITIKSVISSLMTLNITSTVTTNLSLHKLPLLNKS
ncbi:MULTISPECIES: pneumococcal-type histidine triad protein [Streptococcus]|uniref:Pneumococcal-type histidine triad protein n=1 Tax=Streptococcus caledonicus TaxID=2614158 RepID=A0ABW0UEG3_9STRE|nr:pneumococcal-type histidine triad protein [Streptococcus sp. S784/96/1]